MQGWEKRIEEARGRKLLGVLEYPRFTSEDRDLAANWTTCAVGEVRKRYGVRMDRALGQLGVQFYRAVRWNRVERAAQLRDVIEDYALDAKRREWEQQQAARRDRIETSA
jgi:hypothetical protein